MIHLEPGLYLRVQQASKRPHPLLLKSGFSVDVAYRTLGIHSPSETSECYFILMAVFDPLQTLTSPERR